MLPLNALYTVNYLHRSGKNHLRLFENVLRLMGHREIRETCPLTSEGKELAARIFQHLKLSPRGFDRLIKVARTIADLAGSDVIEACHITEAAAYRDTVQRQ